MKNKMTLFKSGFIHRLLSITLAATLVLGMLPTTALGGSSTVTYSRAKPEVPILNAYTGTSTTLYNQLKSEGSGTNFGRYNAFLRLFGLIGRFPDTQAYDWKVGEYANSVIRELSKTPGNLEVNLAATFYNREHNHTHAKGLRKYKYTMTDYEEVSLKVGTRYPVIIAGTYPDKDLKYPRVGDYGAAKANLVTCRDEDATDSYGKVYYSNDTTFKVQFTGATIKYSHFGDPKTCTCSGTYAEKLLMTFRDTRAPKLAGVYYSLDDGANWTPSTSGLRVMHGKTLLIKLSYDEPIRFADDSANGKGDLFLELQEDGASTGSGRNAKLVKLDGNDLYFSYNFTQSDVNWNIESLNTGELFKAPAGSSSIPLKQVYGNQSFALDPSLKGDAGTEGFTTTTCYITDLAGNALAKGSIPAGKLTLDSETPYVKNVQFNLTLNNADVKTALNKTDPKDRDYTDDSDLNLGVGDTVSLVINMNERLKDSTLSGCTAVATTNIKNENDEFVKVQSRYFLPEAERVSGDITSWVMQPLIMKEGWRIDGSGGDSGREIKVTALQITGGGTEITDLAGNALNKNNVTIDTGANANPPLLDVTPPEVTELADSYTSEGDGFRYGVCISDTMCKVEAIEGSFILNNGGDGKSYDYEYAVTLEDKTTDNTVWMTGTVGKAKAYKQHQTFYIHIRPKAGQDYGDLSNCTLTMKAKDYAGNESNVTLSGSDLQSWYIDNLAPTVKAGETQRKLNTTAGTGGTLTAEVILTDGRGISTWDYAWTDSGTAAPDDESDAWKAGDLSDTQSTSVTVTTNAADSQVNDEDVFSQYLWVKATDNTKRNTTDPVCLGLYTYDLRGAQYELDYSPGITARASMKVASIGTDDSLFFLVKEKNAADEYALLRVDSSKSGDIFDNTWTNNSWSYGYTLAGQNGLYTLTKATDGTAVQNTIKKAMAGTYSGELTVVTLSGPSISALESGDTWTLGDETYIFSMDTVTLKAAGVKVDNYEGISIASDSEMGGDPSLSGTATLEHPYRSSLAGMKFTISIAKDKNNWDYADVDWDASYVELKNLTVTPNQSYKFYLQQGRVDENDGSTTQSLTIKEGSYETGTYSATLHLVCAAGQDYERRMTTDGTITGDTAYISVDAVEPKSDFYLKSLTYAPQELRSNKYGIADFYGTLDCLGEVGEGGAITLPVATGPTFGTGYPGQSYQFTISSDNEQPVNGQYGWYVMEMWNTAYPNSKLTIKPESSDQKTVKNNYGKYTGLNAYGFVFDQDTANASPDKYLYLAPDQVNTVAMRKVYSNGEISDVKTVTIKPVTEHITGTVSIDSNANQLVFTPDSADATLGAKTRIYAWAWQNGEDPLKGEGQRIDMARAEDGTWRCNLVENGALYEVITVNNAGSVYDAGFIAERAPWFNRLGGMWGDVGTEGIEFTDNGDGTYELNFRLRDDHSTIQNGMNLDISFNDSYSTDHLAFTVKKGSGLWTDPAEIYPDVYAWTETGASTSGIYSVEVRKYKWDSSNIHGAQEEMDIAYWLDYLQVTVKGCFVPNRNENQAVTDPQTMNVTVTATDAMGNTGSASTGDLTVAYQQPMIYGDAAADGLKPKLDDDGLVLTFNQPVRPVDTWAWHEEDSEVKGFQTQWEGAFPIAGNGTHELQFVDIFGNTCSQELETNAFTKDGKDWSMDLTFSNSNFTGDTVAVTATSQNGFLTFWEGDASGTIWKKDGVYDTVRLIDENGEEWTRESSTMSPEDEEYHYKNIGKRLRAIRWETNGKMYIRCGSGSYSEGNRIYGLNVYIGNIAKSAPSADVRYYIYALGEEFSQEGLERYIAANGGSVTVTGNVQVWYKTTRSVTPTEGGREHLFTPENYQQGHTFTYVDDAGNTGSVAVTLPAGLTLAAPAAPPEDTTAPNVDIDIYTKNSGRYTQAEAFRPGDTDITQRFEGLGYVQDYSLAVNASDDSGYDIAVSGEGATLSGNIVTITKAGEFTITVTDRSSNQNQTSVTFTVPAKIDNTPPVGNITVTANSLYDKTMTIAITDKDDAGQETVNGDADTVTLSLPTDAVRVGKNTYTYHITKNGEVGFEFYDLAGNQGTVGKTVAGIDTEAPTLTVSWSPANSENSDFPPNGPVNTNVTARIRSDKAMHNLTVQAENELSAHNLLVAGVAQDYRIDGVDGALVTFAATPELVTVTYNENYGQNLTFTATAPNGKSTTLTLYGIYSVIDKDAPTITQMQTPLKRAGASVPYAVEVTLKSPDEWVTSPNYGKTMEINGAKQPVEYGYDESLVLTFTENGTYNVRFVDMAGNVTSEPVVITDIDRTPPVLEITTDEANNQVKATVTVNENCIVTAEGNSYPMSANSPKTITFTQNGTFTITATDNAGNGSFRMVRVGSIDNVAPSISFSGGTIYVLTDETDLDAKLNEGFEYSDNMTAKDALAVSIDKTAVDLTTAGQYTVIYTVTDAAGNKTAANRFVRVIGSDTVCLNIDGKLILPDSTAVLRPGTHTLTLTGSSEPYSIKARKGILSAGQMKYLSGSSLSFDENGKFSVTATGYYTLLVTTQSRQTIRILLYVEQ